MKFSHKIAIGLITGIGLGILSNYMLGGIRPDAPYWVKSAHFAGNPVANAGSIMLTFFNAAGDLFLRLIQMIILPLIFVSVTYSVASLGDVRKLRKIGGYTLLYYFGTTAIAVLIGLVMADIFTPGTNAGLKTTVFSGLAEAKTPSIIQTIIRIVPDNIFSAMANSEIIQVVFFSILFGVALGMMRNSFKNLMTLLEELNDLVVLVISWIIKLAPFGVCFLLARSIGQAGIELIAPLARYLGTVLTGLGIHILIVLPILLLVFGKMNPLKAFRGLSDTIATAFSSASSSVALPVNIQNCNEKLGVPRRIVDFVLPLGISLNKNGTALYQAVASVFIAQAYGINLDINQQMVIFITATLASIAAAGIPQAGLFTMIIVLRSAGLPLEGIGLIMAVDNILDMCRTTVNSLGNSFGSVIVSRLSGETEEDPENAPA
ncbi:MAG: dicarboxylate/amino acid:cation symporter [Firmicutes bacterium]|nr:dicarboxylate/amino acid:cation symporter [Bacillota bacterium]